LNIISGSLTNLDNRATASESQLASLNSQISSAEIKLQQSENNLATFETATNDTLSTMIETENMLTSRVLNHEDRLKVLEDKIATLSVQSGQVPDNVVTQDEKGNVTLAGIFETKEVVAGAYSVKNEDPEKKTMGEEVVLAGESGKTIDTKAISDTAKVFVTFESDPGSRYWVEKTTDPVTGEFTGFRVKLSEPTGGDVRFSWWIVESK